MYTQVIKLGAIGLLRLAGVTALIGAALVAPAVQAELSAEEVGMFEDPCTLIAPPPAELLAYLAAAKAAKDEGKGVPEAPKSLRDRYNAWAAKRREQDFADHCRYAALNAELTPATDQRVVFMGDSITEGWGVTDPEFFAGDRVNRGISGQTTAQMIGRFQQDVIALNPAVVHLIAGTNDIAGNTGPTSPEWVKDNIRTMVELAKVNDIKVVIGSVPPATWFDWRPEIKPRNHIAAYNAWLAEYAASEGIGFVDYFAGLSDGEGAFDAALSEDGVHPNNSGFTKMEPLADAAIEKALAD